MRSTRAKEEFFKTKLFTNNQNKIIDFKLRYPFEFFNLPAIASFKPSTKIK